MRAVTAARVGASPAAPRAPPTSSTAAAAAQELASLQSQLSTVRASAALLSDVLRRMPDLVVVVDALGSLRWASPSAEVLLGATPAALVGTAFSARLAPPCRSQVEGAALARLLAAPASDAPTCFSHALMHADGGRTAVDGVARAWVREPNTEPVLIIEIGRAHV